MDFSIVNHLLSLQRSRSSACAEKLLSRDEVGRVVDNHFAKVPFPRGNEMSQAASAADGLQVEILKRCLCINSLCLQAPNSLGACLLCVCNQDVCRRHFENYEAL
jgi:hypothetical protein